VLEHVFELATFLVYKCPQMPLLHFYIFSSKLPYCTSSFLDVTALIGMFVRRPHAMKAATGSVVGRATHYCGATVYTKRLLDDQSVQVVRDCIINNSDKLNIHSTKVLILLNIYTI
jgi:hypothetical protein